MAVVMKETVSELTCDRCGHRWKPRYDSLPKVCPECKRTDWNSGAQRVDAEDVDNG